MILALLRQGHRLTPPIEIASSPEPQPVSHQLISASYKDNGHFLA